MGSSQVLSRNTFRVPLANVSNFARVQLTVLSSLANHVLHVVCGRTKEQVIGSYTVADIAPVANLQIFWDWAIVQLPRYTMRLLCCLSGVKSAVAVNRYRPNPQPAVSRFIDLAPELFSQAEPVTQSETALTTKLGRIPKRGRRDTELTVTLLAGSYNLFSSACSVSTQARAIQRAALEGRRRYVKVLRTLLTGSQDSCYVSISHAAYVSIVRGLVRLAPALTLPVQAV